MEDKTRIKLELALFGGLLNPLVFSDLIGINPTEYWNEGEEVPGNRFNLKRKETVWHYTIDYIETVDIEGITSEFSKVFSDKVDLIKNYLNKYRVEAKVYFVIEIWNEESPSVYFNKRFLNLINEINAEIDIDLYYISE